MPTTCVCRESGQVCQFVRRTFIRLSFLVALVAIASTGLAADAASARAFESITAADIRKHVSFLASDTLEGREAGSRGGKAAGIYLVQELEKRNLQPGGSNKSFYQHFGNDYRNILGVIPGSDERLKHEFILIGAHYDHVGYGSSSNSFGPTGYIHNGADDNASGTTALLELIDAVSHLETAPRRSLLFVFWDAEEKGLLGSEHWASQPTIRLSQLKLAINMDMVGRLRGNLLEVYGVRTAAGLTRLITEANEGIELAMEFNWTNTNDSDHYSFYKRNVPYLMLHTKKHGEYHRPSDDLHLLNYDGLQQITQLLFRAVHAAANEDQLAPFRSQARSESNGVKPGYSIRLANDPPRLGIGWDAAVAANEGIVQVTSVSAGSAASKAGFQIGDRIVSFGGFTRDDSPNDFAMYVIAADSRLAAVVERKGADQPVTLSVELPGTPQRLGLSWRTDDAEPGTLTLTRVIPGSSADRAGLKVAHSILRVNGRRFADAEEFLQLTEEAEGEVELLVEGKGIVRPVKVALPRRRAAGN